MSQNRQVVFPDDPAHEIHRHFRSRVTTLIVAGSEEQLKPDNGKRTSGAGLNAGGHVDVEVT